MRRAPLKHDIKSLLSDWINILSLVGSVFAVVGFLNSLIGVGLSETARNLLDAYRSIFHFPFNFISRYFDYDVPLWLRELLVFWVLTATIGYRVYVRLSREFVDFIEGSLQRLATTERSPQALESLVSNLGSYEAYEAEKRFMQDQLSIHKETLNRRFTLRIGCLMSGPLFFLAFFLWSTPVPRSKFNGRRQAILEFVTLIVAVILFLILGWSY